MPQLEHEQRVIDALRNHAPTAALVGQRIAINAQPQDAARPYITVTTSLTPDKGLADNILAWGLQTSVECWAANAIQAGALADRAQAALIAAGFPPPSRVSGYDAEQGLDAVVLTIEQWLAPDEITVP